jgi:acetolactate synthase-1/2/3 large subunit
MLDLTNPELRWTDIAKGMGVPAWRVHTVEELVEALQRAQATEGPALIEAMVP